MNQLLTITKENASILTMSSREIAEITHKEHKNVLRVIRDLIEQNLVAQIEQLKFEYRNQWFDYYELNKRDTFVVLQIRFVLNVRKIWCVIGAIFSRMT